jgi:hypothetical protein
MPLNAPKGAFLRPIRVNGRIVSLARPLTAVF